MQVTQDILDKLITRIRRVVEPLQVIIFGSAARGLMAPDSDLDILVVAPNGTHRRRTCELIHTQLAGFDLPVDVIVTTKENLEAHKDNPGLIYRTILREGKIVYAG